MRFILAHLIVVALIVVLAAMAVANRYNLRFHATPFDIELTPNPATTIDRPR
jgi:hypothetical protein